MNKLLFFGIILFSVFVMAFAEPSLRLQADFNALDTLGYEPLEVQFRDLTSEGIPVNWEWDFQNDGIIDSYDHNPVWIYEEPGLYSVSLTVSDEQMLEISTVVKDDYINVMEVIDGMVACYMFDGNADDSTPNNYNGEIFGAQLTSDRFGNMDSAYYFDGVNDRITIPYNLFSSGFPFTVSLWIKPIEIIQYSNIFLGNKAWDTGGMDIYFAVNSMGIWNDRFFWQFGNGAGGSSENRRAFRSFYPFYEDKWTHIVLIATDTFMENGRVYIDGVENDFEYASGTATFTNFYGGTLDMGCVKGNDNSYDEFPKFNGVMDDIMIFDRELSEEEIAELFTPGMTADFTALPITGDTPLSVQFTDLSTNPFMINSWSWDFDNDGVIDSYDQNPVWIFDEIGPHDVKLTVSTENQRDYDWMIKQNFINVTEIVYGDVNNDHALDSYDASLILMHYVGLDPIEEDPVPWDEWRFIRADVDQDGVLSSFDAAIILRYIMGFIPELPIE